MFAEDAALLKSNLFTELAEKGVEHPEHFDTFVKRLFQAMQNGGPFGTEIIDWFNGGLFDSDDTIPLTLSQIRIVRDLARMDWSQIEPAIFGTLFERGLDPEKRSQLGAHYTDPGSIMRLVNPTIVDPLMAEWREVRSEIAGPNGTHGKGQVSVRNKKASKGGGRRVLRLSRATSKLPCFGSCLRFRKFPVSLAAGAEENRTSGKY